MFNFIHILVQNSIYIFSIFTFIIIHLYSGVHRTGHICKARYRCSMPSFWDFVCVRSCACTLWRASVHVHAAVCYHLPHTFRSVVCNLLLQPFISQNFFLNPYQKSQSETVFNLYCSTTPYAGL